MKDATAALWLGSAKPSSEICIGGPGCCRRKASMLILDDSDAVAASVTLSYCEDQNCRTRVCCNCLVTYCTCLWIAVLTCTACVGQYLCEDMFTGSIYACSDTQSPTSDHRPEEDRNGHVPSQAWTRRTPGSTIWRSRNAARNQSDCK